MWQAYRNNILLSNQHSQLRQKNKKHPLPTLFGLKPEYCAEKWQSQARQESNAEARGNTVNHDQNANCEQKDYEQ